MLRELPASRDVNVKLLHCTALYCMVCNPFPRQSGTAAALVEVEAGDDATGWVW